MTTARTPSVNLEGFDHLLFVYDDEDDVAHIHIGGPRPAMTEPLDDGWNLRLADDEIVGMELHGLKRIFLTTPLYSALFRPAIAELEAFTGQSFEDGDFRAEGHIDQLPRTTHLLIFMIGQAVVKYESVRRSEYADAGRRLLAV